MDLYNLTIFNRYTKYNKRRMTLINPFRKYNNTVPFIRPYCVNIIIIICDSNKQYRVSRKLHPTEHNFRNVCQGSARTTARIQGLAESGLFPVNIYISMRRLRQPSEKM